MCLRFRSVLQPEALIDFVQKGDSTGGQTGVGMQIAYKRDGGKCRFTLAAPGEHVGRLVGAHIIPRGAKAIVSDPLAYAVS